MTKTLAILVIALGGLLAYFDSRPTWNDTGVMAGGVFLSRALLAAASPHYPWFWALAVGALDSDLRHRPIAKYAALLALVFAFAGADAAQLRPAHLRRRMTSKPPGSA